MVWWSGHQSCNHRFNSQPCHFT